MWLVLIGVRYRCKIHCGFQRVSVKKKKKEGKFYSDEMFYSDQFYSDEMLTW